MRPRALYQPSQGRGLQSEAIQVGQRTSLRAEARAPHPVVTAEQGLQAQADPRVRRARCRWLPVMEALVRGLPGLAAQDHRWTETAVTFSTPVAQVAGTFLQPLVTNRLDGTHAGDSYSDEANTATPSADGRLGINPDRVIRDARLAKLIMLCANANLELAVGASNPFDEDWYAHSRGGFFGPGLAAGPPRQIYDSLGVPLQC